MRADQQQAFIRDYPAEAGNTNGIPFDTRVEANRANAQERIDWLRSNDPEPIFNPLLMDMASAQRYSEEHAAGAERRVNLLHDDGTHLMVSFHDSPATLRVAGYSACFDFPEYEYGEKY